MDVLASLLFVGLWTRPPVTYGFSLSDCWAWLRYFPAIATTSELRLRDEWTTLDPHHKTVLSGDFGVGFTTWFLHLTLGFVRYADTLWVVNSLRPGLFRHVAAGKHGPTKSPDYIAEDVNGDISVLECKGTQSSRASLRAALATGAVQKSNLQTIGTTSIRHSLVAGLFIPQFDSSESAALMVADPAWENIKEMLLPFSKDALARAVVGVSYAKELAMLNFPNLANTLVQAPGSDESVAAALERDRALFGLGDGAVRVERDYRWSSPVALDEHRNARGIRFTGALEPNSIDELLRSKTPAAVADEKHDRSREHTWEIDSGDMTIAVRSPTGSLFGLSLLEE